MEAIVGGPVFSTWHHFSAMGMTFHLCLWVWHLGGVQNVFAEPVTIRGTNAWDKTHPQFPDFHLKSS
jgi:hypothetical protein